MINFGLKLGNSKNILNTIAIKDGTIYLVKDLNELFVDIQNVRHKITDTSGLYFEIGETITFNSEIANGYFILNSSVLNGQDVLG